MCGQFLFGSFEMCERVKIYPGLFLFAILGMTWIVYWPGLNGGFLFDDFINLEPLGSFGGVKDWETAKAFIFNGVASSIGRPLSLATFLIDDTTWPSQASYFKPTNVKIHIINGLLVIWASLLILRSLKRNEAEAIWISLIAGAIWLLHPYMVSTTLYVIQRMALLSALFMLAGICAYLKGRALLIAGRYAAGYVCISAGVGIGTLLALLSKENGALLPLCILIIESVLPKFSAPLITWWRVAFLIVPAIAVVGYLISLFELTDSPAYGRRYSQIERLITQPRIIWEYISHLLLPRIEGRGLFQDGYVFSTNLWSPITTLPSIICLLGVLFWSVAYRARFPLICFAILFFLSSHLMESTWLNLELYFEHRNYLASAFLFLPIAAAIVNLRKRYGAKISIASGIGLISVLMFLTYNRVQLWADSDKLEIYWALSSTDSPRAQNRLGTLLLERAGPEKAIEYMEAASKRFPDSSLLSSNLLLIKVFSSLATLGDFELTADAMRRQPFDAQAVKGLRNLADEIAQPDAPKIYAEAMIMLIDKVYENKSYGGVGLYVRVDQYIRGLMYIKLQNYDAALQSLLKAIDVYNETDAALSIVAEMAEAKPEYALILLDKAEMVYKHQPERTLIRSREVYDYEIERLRKILHYSIQKDHDASPQR